MSERGYGGKWSRIREKVLSPDLASWLLEQIAEDERQAEIARVHGIDAHHVDQTVEDYVLGDPAACWSSAKPNERSSKCSTSLTA